MDKNIQTTIDTLKKGGICVFPTDTAFGIGCRMDRADSVKRVFEIRKRPEEKAVLVLVSDIEMAEQYVQVPDEVKKKLVEKYWPGPLTIILPCKTDNVPAVVRANNRTLAVRMPDHTQLQYIVQEVGVPIVAPSANFAGGLTPTTFEELDPTLVKLVDFVLPGECTTRGVSTIIDCSVIPWKIVRQGVVKIQIEE